MEVRWSSAALRCCHRIASPSYSFRYRLVLSDRLARRTTFLRGTEEVLGSCGQEPQAGRCRGPRSHRTTHPRLPALDVLRLRDDLCLSWDFMMTSCLCLSSNSRTLNSSSSHRSEGGQESVAEGKVGVPYHRSHHEDIQKTLENLLGHRGRGESNPCLFLQKRVGMGDLGL